jgi:adenine-specific DNA-methyltransferase
LSEARFILSDCLDGLDAVGDGTVKLVLSSPPYNLGKVYERDQKRSLEEYKAWFAPIANKIVNKVLADGHVCWQSGNYVQNGALVPLDYFFYEIFTSLGLVLRNRIIWQFDFGLHAKKRFSGRYETILWFSKGDSYTFNLDPVRVPQRYPGKRHALSKGEKAGTPSGNPKGKNPGDFWTFLPQQEMHESNIWRFPNVKANHVEKTLHPCQFPIELAERCVLALTNSGDVVLDPFAGVGTSVIAAVRHGRGGIGIDRDPVYIGLAQERLDSLLGGTLRVREMGRPVTEPARNQRVAQLPREWMDEHEEAKIA